MDNKLDKYSNSPVSYKEYLKKEAKTMLKDVPKEAPTEPAPEFLAPAPQVSSSQREFSDFARQHQEGVLPQMGAITQRFGAINPDVEVFSGGKNYGTDIATPSGTPVALPPGRWVAVDSFNQDKAKGHIGNKSNKGYGNSVLFQNLDTGEKLRFSHLSQANVEAGNIFNGGDVFGLSGETGNVTGPHLDLEYYNKQGQLADIMMSLFAQYLGKK